MANNWGGSRNGSGAKKKEAKRPITVYLHKDEIDKLGGREDVRFMIYSWWEEQLGIPHGTFYNHNVKQL